MSNDIEKRIIAAQPSSRGNKDFVARTMLAVKKAKTGHTFSQALQDTNEKKSWLTKLKHLPGPIIAVIVIGVILLLSGTAYAAYRLWLSPEASVRSVEQKYGRDQALIELKNCSSSDESVEVEINRDKSGTPDEAAMVIAAGCENMAILDWAVTSLGVDSTTIPIPFTVTEIRGRHVTMTNQYQETRTFTVNKDAPVVFKGEIIKLSNLQKGDVVTAVVTGVNQDLRALVKLSYPVRYYNSTELQNSYHTRHECYGNPGSSCIDLPSLGVLRTGEGGANPETQGEVRVIQGKLVDYNASQFTIQSTNGVTYTVRTTGNPIGVFNAGNPYGAVTIEKDDVLEVRYSQGVSGNPKEIQATQYHSIQLLLQGFDKKASADKNLQKYRY